MDPQKALDEMAECVENDEWERAAEIASDLRTWVDRGGFIPDIIGKPKFDTMLLWLACEAVISWEVV